MLFLDRAVLIGVLLCSIPLAMAAPATSPRPVEDPFERFEQQGFDIVFRGRDGRRISKSEFEAHGKDHPVAMRVDGDTKTVEVTLDGEIPPEFEVPLAIAPGAPLPMLSLRGLDGVSHTWPRPDGKYTLLDFYFSGCGPCIEAIPELNAFQREHPEVAVLAVTFDDADESARFARDRGFAWDIVPDARDLIDALGVSVYPTVMLVDPRGRLVAVRKAVSAHDEKSQQTLHAWVSEALAGTAR